MNVPSKIAVAAASLALGVAPAAALAHGNPTNHGKSQQAAGHNKSSASHSNSSSTAPGGKAKAYGRYCQGESKKHIAGQKGTPFSNCVRDMAQLAKSSRTNPHKACANESKQHVAGQKGTPYSQCVVAAAKLHKSQNTQSGSGSSSAGPSSTATQS